MRADFIKFLHGRMSQDRRLHLLTADIGYGVLNPIRIDYPGRFTDFGASEQLMVGAACGMALSGLRPVCYSITPFVLYRPFEWLRNFLHEDRIPVKLVGAGRDRDYGHLGSTHWAEDDTAVLAALPNIQVFKPLPADAHDAFALFLECPGPAYLNLSK
jgi:transketolase